MCLQLTLKHPSESPEVTCPDLGLRVFGAMKKHNDGEETEECRLSQVTFYRFMHQASGLLMIYFTIIFLHVVG